LWADETDPPHQTHLTAGNGPSCFFLVEGLDIDEECQRCHEGPPSWINVDTDRCATCHTTGGAYEGVTDSTVGALNNWDNWDSSTGAAESLIYDTPGNLKSGKERWCVGCHDQTESGTADRGTPIDDFESGLSDWVSGGDISGSSVEPYLETDRPEQGINGQYVKLELKWSQTTQSFGRLKKNLTGNEQDFGNRDSFNFYLLMEDAISIMGIIATLEIDGQLSYCICYFNYDGDPGQNMDIKINGFQDNVWKLVSLPRAAFNGPAWDSGFVKSITIDFYEEAAGGDYTRLFCIDEFGCDITPHNVVSDNNDSGYYVTGHKITCSQCHDISSAHIDGNVLQILEYVKNTSNSTSFRFYNDTAKQLRLPYNYDNTTAYNSDDFALCYRCHSETNLIGDPWGDGTNFKDKNVGTCQMQKNYHYLHVYDFAGGQSGQSCAHCHDPHGQFYPAMTRKEMGEAIVFDTGGCEILPGDDSDGDGVDDRHDPDVNAGVALQSDLFALGDTCDSCHGGFGGGITPPNQPPCNPEDNPYTPADCLGDWSYLRSYETVPHTGEPDIACMECHRDEGHATHFDTEGQGPGMAEDNDGCDCCHEGLAPGLKDGACDNCHSDGGAFDGAQMALANWDGGVYEEDGSLKSGNEDWCLSCHDADQASSNQDGSGALALP